MSKNFLTIAIAVLAFAYLWGQNEIRVVEQNPEMIVLKYDGGLPEFVDLGDFVRLILPGASPSDLVGYPELPVIRRLVQIPAEASYYVEVVDPQYEEIDIEKPIYPRQPPKIKLPLTGSDDLVIDKWFYLTGNYCFKTFAEIREEAFVRAYRLILLEIHPIDYSPTQQKLKVLRNATIYLYFNNSDVQKTQALHAKYDNPYFDETLKDIILNPEFLRPMWVPPLQIGYYIIAPSSYQTILADFIKWKKRKGFKVVVKTPSELGGTANSIKSYLQTQYNSGNPSPTFILLVGDVADVPTFTGPSSTPASDLPYTLLYGSDYLPDAMIGRLSVSSASELQGLVQKILAYEKYNLPSNVWLSKACFIASDDPTYWSVAEGTHRYVIRRWLGPLGMACDSIWGYSGGSTSDVANAINAGRVVVNYSGHGTPTQWVGPAFTQSNVRSLTNANMYPFVISNACQTNTFSNTECFGETWIRNSNKAALGFFGASNYTYWEEDDTLERRIFDSIFGNEYYLLGGMIQRGLYGVYTALPSNAEYYYYIYNLLGDPSLALWIKAPQPMTVTHPATSRMGLDTITVTVMSGSTPIDSALVCITNDSTIHQVGYTNTSGVVRIPVSGASGETLRVTVTAYNYAPYEGIIIVGANGPYLVYSSQVINDDRIGSSIGDSDEQMDAGERIELTITVRNIGNASAQGVVGTLTTTDPYITIRTGTSPYGNIGAGASANNTTLFVLDISPNVPNNYPASLRLTTRDTNDSVWVFSIVEVLRSPVMNLFSSSVSDPSPGGDGDGFCEPGETINLSVTVKNTGGEKARSVVGTIRSLSPYLTVITSRSEFGDIGEDSTKTGTPNFLVCTDAGTPSMTNVSLELTLTNSLSQVVYDTITFMVGTGGFFDDVESGEGSWTQTNWHITEWRANSPTHSWYLGRELYHSYPDTTTYTLITPAFVLPANSYLTFWHLYATEIGYDTCYVHIKYGSSSWTRLGAYNGMSRVFNFAYFDLSSIPAGSSCQVRFSLVSDQRVHNEGWFIDDIYVGPAKDGELGAGDVYPPAGDTATTYKFSVTYASLRSFEPANVRVYIDGVPFNMNFESGTLPDGKVFSYQTSLPTGTHRYYFTCTSNGREIRFPKWGEKIGPYVSAPLLVYDLGSSSSDFTTSGSRNDWEYGVPSNVGPTSVPNGSRCWATKISANYRDSSASRLITPPINLSGVSHPFLRILHWYSFQSTTSLIGHDGGNVKSILPGDTLVLLYPPRNYDGQVSSYNFMIPYQQGFIDNDKGNFWHYDVFDISHLAGRTVRFYFDFGSSSRTNDAGWYINRVEIFGGISSDVSNEEFARSLPEKLELAPPYPNPFNARTFFTIRTERDELYRLYIYNITGEQVKLICGEAKKGTTRVQWDGEDSAQRALPTGIYLYRLECGAKLITGKVILLK